MLLDSGLCCAQVKQGAVLSRGWGQSWGGSAWPGPGGNIRTNHM